MTPKASPRRRQLLEQLDTITATAKRAERASMFDIERAGGFGIAPTPLIATNLVHAARRARGAWLHARLAARTIAIFLLLLVVAPSPATEHWQVDQPASWYRFDVSHHGAHAAAGAAIGVASYGAVRVVGGGRGDGVAVSVIAGAIAGMAHELIAARDGSAWVDPVDALWTTAGAAVGAATAAITDRVIGAAIAITPTSGGVVVAWSHRF